MSVTFLPLDVQFFFSITLSSKNLLSVSSDEDYVDVQDSEFNDFGQSMTHPTAWSENSILTLSVEDHQEIELVEPKKGVSSFVFGNEKIKPYGKLVF